MEHLWSKIKSWINSNLNISNISSQTFEINLYNFGNAYLSIAYSRYQLGLNIISAESAYGIAISDTGGNGTFVSNTTSYTLKVVCLYVKTDNSLGFGGAESVAPSDAVKVLGTTNLKAGYPCLIFWNYEE